MTLAISRELKRPNLERQVCQLTERPEPPIDTKLVCRWFPTGKSYPKMEARWVLESQ